MFDLPEGMTEEDVRVNPMRVLKKIWFTDGKDAATEFVNDFESAIPAQAPQTVPMVHTLKNMREFIQQPEPTNDPKARQEVPGRKQEGQEPRNVSVPQSRGQTVGTGGVLQA